MSGMCITLEMQDAVAARLYEHELNRCGLVFDTVDYEKLPDLSKNIYREQAIQAIKGLWNESDDWQELIAGIWDEGFRAGAIEECAEDASGLDADEKAQAFSAAMKETNPYRTPEGQTEENQTKEDQ